MKRKKQRDGRLLTLHRYGDFYEAFNEDAAIVSSSLGLTLTTRSKSETSTPMTCFPYHQLGAYLGKLLDLGYRVSIEGEREVVSHA